MQTKAKELLTLVFFAGSLSLQGFGLQPAVRPCCAQKLNHRKGDVAISEQKKKLKLRQSERDQHKDN